MNKAPAFQLYPNDWLSSPRIAMMSPAQEGAYFRLLCYDWTNDGIPDSDEALAQLSRLGEGWFKGGSQLVRNCFHQHPTKEGFLTNKRLQSEREKQRLWREKSAKGGEASAVSRSNSANLKGGSRVVKKSLNQTSTLLSSSASSSSNKEPLPLTGREIDERFEVFWQVYPRKISKADAHKAFKKANRAQHLPTMLTAIESQKKSRDWTRENGQFIPYPATWLNAERWNDEVSPAHVRDNRVLFIP